MGRENRSIQRASRVWQEGPRALPMKVLTTFYRRVIVVTRLLEETIPDPSPRLPVDIKMLTEKEVSAYRAFRSDQGVDVVEARLGRADRCFAAWHEGRIVHAIWVATGRVFVPYLRRDLILEPEDAFSYDSYTLPTYRGRGLAQSTKAQVLRHYRQEGFRRAVNIIAVENKAGFGPSQAVGYRAVGMYGCVRFGPWQWDWQQRWAEESLPVLTRAELRSE